MQNVSRSEVNDYKSNGKTATWSHTGNAKRIYQITFTRYRSAPDIMDEFGKGPSTPQNEPQRASK